MPTPLERALKDFAEQTFRDFSRFRWAEEREWYEAALFYQRRQWLSWDGEGRRWRQIKQDQKRPRPMPVSNYFAMTINAQANQLAASMPRMQAQALSDDDGDRRAADMAEKAIPAIDKESGMDVLNTLLAKHTVLWGMGIAKDSYDASLATGTTPVPRMRVQKTQRLACQDCGGSYDVEPPQERSRESPEPAGHRGAVMEKAPRCPQCGSGRTVAYTRSTPEADQIARYTRGKIVTEIRPIFEMYLPRDAQNPNLAKRICQRYRKSLGALRRQFPEQAQDIQADASVEVHEIYLEALRSLVAYSWMDEQTAQATTVTEVWADWDELSEDVQEGIEAECDAGDQEQWRKLGGFVITAGGKLLDWGPNPFDGEKPYTFYLWEVDPASTYPKGLATDLIPLQKRLNRIDSLMELAMMCNAVGKWMWPKTQTCKPPSGSPNEVAEYDVIGDGKIAPSFVQPSPIHQSAWEFRQTILQDFQQLGLTQGAGRGEAPENVSSFRGLAYLGAKADEQINTQRFLFETGHKLRYQKCLTIARKFWDEPRLSRVAGPNGKYLVERFIGEELEGAYDLELIPGSSRPQSLAEKQQAFAGLLQAGMVDVNDPSTRDYVLDMANLPDVALTDSLQYLKAQRDLERAKQGVAPVPNPFIKFDVFLKVFVDFTLTEEFADLAPEVQQLISQTAAGWAAKLSQIKSQMAPPGKGAKPEKPSETIAFKDVAAFSPQAAAGMLAQAGITAPAPPPELAPVAPGPQKAQVLGAALARPQNPLQGVPGVSQGPAAAEQAALDQGNAMAHALP